MTDKATRSVTTSTSVVCPYFRRTKTPNPTNEGLQKTVKMRRTCRPENIQIQDLKAYKA